MTKSKTNALDALRALIAERQQYDQWISTLESKRDRTPEHVFNRVYSDYRSRLERVLGEIRGHAEELQLSITALSGRLAEVAKEEEAKRDSLQEAELRAAVGEYDVAQWESVQAEANRELDKIAGDRASLEGQLGELESIRKLSEVTAPPQAQVAAAAPAQMETAPARPAGDGRSTSATGASDRAVMRESERIETRRPPPSDAGWPTREVIETPASATPPASAAAAGAPSTSATQSASATPSGSTTPAGSATPSVSATPSRSATPSEGALDTQIPAQSPSAAQSSSFSGRAAFPSGRSGFVGEAPQPRVDPGAAAPRPSAFPIASPPAPTPPPRKKRDTPSGKDTQISSGVSKPMRTPSESRPEVNKTLKCPECGTANYPTEWYCEKCGGELATM